MVQDQNRPDEKGTFREWLYITVFQSSTVAGKIFDIGLSVLILSNIILLMLESVPSISAKYEPAFQKFDVFFLVIFSGEYLLRLYCVRSAKKYAASFYGVIDLMAILPSYMEFLYPQWHVFMIVRCFRLLRIFRIFRMVRFLDESRILMLALIRGFRKILVFLFFVLLLAIFLGSLMYVVEFQKNSGFNTIPQSIYWAIVTITTVGYGDVAPVTATGKVIASFIMILGYAIIAVPTGILSASVIQEEKRNQGRRCPQCQVAGHDKEAIYCKNCGSKLSEQ
ncbi:Ion transport protein [Niabella ginsenosidivorans]|uniref:Ion transport protein n=1 Tax=Niabella ginsenosidivorans TaxID=1176587 RepID=A0A1A9I9V1_9BACT|nr:Ion transport protein [Niabella ginsenosidivorans]